MKRGALGRADLICWALSLDDARLGRLAETLGYQEQPDAQVVDTGFVAIGGLRVAASERETPTAAAAPRHRQYRVVERRALAPLPAGAEPQPDLKPEPPVAPLGPPPPLIPWPRLWPFLRAALGDLAERNRIDLPRLVATCCRLQPLRRLPRLKGQRWAPAGQLILDLHPRLYPFWGDFNALKTALPRLRGGTDLEILRMDQGPDGPVQRWEAGDWGPRHPYVPPAAGTPVLIAGDLGCLGTAAQREAWVRLGRQLAGSGRQPVALTPCPPRWWDPELAGLYFPVALDRGSRIPARPGGPRPWPAQATDLATAVQEDAGARLLLTLLGACVAIRPALLRHLRHRLPAHLADVGSEAAAWQHPAFVAADFELLPGDPVQLEQLRLAFPTTGSAGERQLAWDLIRAQQAQGATRSRCMEERVLHAAMNGRSDPVAEDFMDEVAGALDQADPEHTRALADLVNRHAQRMHPDGWRYSPRFEALWLKANPQAEEEGAPLPSGYHLGRALAAAGRPEHPQDWRLVQRGEALEFEPVPQVQASLTCGSPVVDRLRVRRPLVQVHANRPGAPELSLPVEAGAALPPGESGWRMQTDLEALVIAPVDRPVWAHTLGRDGDGLFVGFNDGQGERRAYWCPPLEWLRWPGSPVDLDLRSGHKKTGGRGFSRSTSSPGGPGPAKASTSGARRPRAGRSDHDGLSLSGRGTFVDAEQFKALRSFGLVPAGAGWTLTRDRFGLRLEIAIKGVAIGLRWVWPGGFQMGSPQSEKGRYDDESRHEVILTRGFWLAETACTQALWQAVMGENPSNHKGPELPVEQVSWEDAQRFIERLNAELAASLEGAITRASAQSAGASSVSSAGIVGLKPDLQPDRQPEVRPDVQPDRQPAPGCTLQFRLPTEAQWEYACRAGTTTAYSFGDDFDSKLANDGGKTVAVGSLPPNPWGFHEMHGNVYEWCEDWFGDYPAGPVVDPLGAASGVRRVLRGGCWFCGALSLRSACRSLVDPGFRYQHGGFRLALGPELRPAGEGRLEGSGAGLPAQGASGSERKARAVRPRGGSGGTGA